MTQLFIEGNLFETEELKVAQVYQINDFAEPKDRQLDYSLNFQIPATDSNVLLLDMLGIVGNQSNKPYKELSAKLVQNNIEVIQEGFVTISSRSTDTNGDSFFNANIYGGNVFLFDLIGQKKINELDFTSIGFTISREAFTESFDNTEGYIYSLANYGAGVERSDLNGTIYTCLFIQYQLPSVFVHTIWDMIFKQSGIQYEGAIFQSAKFKELLLSMVRGFNYDVEADGNPLRVVITSDLKNRGPEYEDVDFYFAWPEDVPSIIGPLPYDFYDRDIIDLDDDFTNENINTSTNEVNIQKDGDYRLRTGMTWYTRNFNGDSTEMKIFAKFDRVRLYVRVTRNGTEQTLTAYNIEARGDNQYYTIIDDTFPCLAGDKVKFVVCYEWDSFNKPNVGFEVSISLRINQRPSIPSGFIFEIVQDDFDYAGFIGDNSQIGFVKDVMQQFGLTMQKRKNNLNDLVGGFFISTTYLRIDGLEYLFYFEDYNVEDEPEYLGLLLTGSSSVITQFNSATYYKDLQINLSNGSITTFTGTIVSSLTDLGSTFTTEIGDRVTSQVESLLFQFQYVEKIKPKLIYDFIETNELLTDFENSIDWSDKFVKELKQNYKLSNYAQSNVFAYNYLNEDDEKVANSNFLVSNENLQSEKTLITRPYNAPVISETQILPDDSSSNQSAQDILNIPFWNVEEDSQGNVSFSPFSSKSYFTKYAYNNEINFTYGFDADVILTQGFPYQTFDGLDWQTILAENYGELKRLIDNNQVYSFEIELDELDINKLNLFRLIFLEQYSAYFYVNKILYVDSTTNAKVEMVKIPTKKV